MTQRMDGRNNEIVAALKERVEMRSAHPTMIELAAKHKITSARVSKIWKDYGPGFSFAAGWRQMEGGEDE